MLKSTLVVLLGTALYLPMPVMAAQNGHPFDDARQSGVNYRETPFDASTPCASVAGPVV